MNRVMPGLAGLVVPRQAGLVSTHISSVLALVGNSAIRG
jgi:hypothetical protein